MSDIEFDSDIQARRVLSPSSVGAPEARRGMTGWLISRGIVRNEKQATVILIGIIIACIVIGYLASHRSPSVQGGKPMPPNTYYGS